MLLRLIRKNRLDFAGITKLTPERRTMGMMEYPRMLVIELSVTPVAESLSSPMRR